MLFQQMNIRKTIPEVERLHLLIHVHHLESFFTQMGLFLHPFLGLPYVILVSEKSCLPRSLVQPLGNREKGQSKRGKGKHPNLKSRNGGRG